MFRSARGLAIVASAFWCSPFYNPVITRGSTVIEDMMVISALKHVANAATNAVHSATNSTTGHGHANSGRSGSLCTVPSWEDVTWIELNVTSRVRNVRTTSRQFFAEY